MQNRLVSGSHSLNIRLLGSLELTDSSGTQIRLAGRKNRALMAFLAMHLGVAVPRDRLVEMIWPNAAEGAGRASLRQSLSTIRKALPVELAPAISTDRDAVMLDSDLVETDIHSLERSRNEEELAMRFDPLINGVILDGLGNVSASFDTWRASEVARLVPLAVDVLSRLADKAEGDRRHADAIHFLSQALVADPMAEEVTRRVMSLHFKSGRPEVALRQYQALETFLESELGARPDRDTQELAREIRTSRTRKVNAPPSKAAQIDAEPAEKISSLARARAPTTTGESRSSNRKEVQGHTEPNIEETIGLDFSIPDYPSIAVLPFSVLSGDAEQEFFSDGVVEDIITALAKISRLLVVARNSTFTYKNRAVDVRQVSKDQGVRFVLEGSVRKAGNRVRITAQLVDATTGMHIWAERYDRELVNIFALQDEIVREIVTALDVQLREGEQHRVWSDGTQNLEAWECVRLATDGVLGGAAEAQPRATELIERALNLDPDYAVAWAMRGWLYFTEADVGGGLGNWDQFDRAQTAAFRCGHRALEIDPNCADAMGMLALTHLNAGEHDKALEMSERAIEIAPNNAELLGGVASAVMRKSGHPERGAELVKKAMRLCPFYRPGLLRALANNYMGMERLEEAVACYRESLRRETGYLAPYVNLTASLSRLGRFDEAEEAAKEVLRQKPDFSIASYCQGLSYRDPADIDRIAEGLRSAGLPA